MSVRAFTFAIAGAVAIPSFSRAETTETAAQCFFDEGRVVAVRPHYGKATMGGAALQTLRGAELQLLPTSGLTSEYLQAHLERLIDARDRQPLPACLSNVGHVHIESTALGEAASVTLIARHPQHAERVYRRARLLMDE